MVKGQKIKKIPRYWYNKEEKRNAHKRERKDNKKEIKTYLYEDLADPIFFE